MIMSVSPDLILLAKAALAGVLGFIVGWERETHGHEAGIRTIALITMGGAVFTSIAAEVYPTPDRLTANILTGIGFLGAGMILRGSDSHVRGLTSAAAIWAMTAVSIVIGVGHYLLGVGLTVFVLLLLWWQYIPLLKHLNPSRTQRAMAERDAVTDGEKD